MMLLDLEAFEGIESEDQTSMKVKGYASIGFTSTWGALMLALGGIVDCCKATKLATTNPNCWTS